MSEIAKRVAFKWLRAQDEDPAAAPVSGSMTVQQLIAELQKQDPNAPVGVCMSDLHGWVQDVKGVSLANGVVCIDQGQSTLFEEEVDIESA